MTSRGWLRGLVALTAASGGAAAVHFHNEIASLRRQLEEVRTAEITKNAAVLRGELQDCKLPTYSGVVQAVQPATVSIETRSERRIRFGGYVAEIPGEDSIGSGVLIEEEGIVVTNKHVVDKATEVTVTLFDGSKYKGEVLARDSDIDLAILRLVGTKGAKFPTLPIARSTELKVGDFVLAFGSNLGFEKTVTQGIVSAVGRCLERDDHLSSKSSPLIQTDAAINQGNSGGALVNLKGELVGINNMIASPSGGYVGISFAVPSQFIRPLLEGVHQKKHDSIKGWTGMALVKDGCCLRVQWVTPDGPAEKAGIRKGDLIEGLDGERVATLEEFSVYNGGVVPGDKRSFTIRRGDSTLSIPVIAGVEPRAATRRWSGEDLAGTVLYGTKLVGIQPEKCAEEGLPPNTQALRVESVSRGSHAHMYGIQPGDLILAINNVPISDFTDVPGALRGAVNEILIQRNGRRGVITKAFPR